MVGNEIPKSRTQKHAQKDLEHVVGGRGRRRLIHGQLAQLSPGQGAPRPST